MNPSGYFGAAATYIHSSFINFSDRRAIGFLGFFAVALRLVPEILSFPYPIGFDTVYYGWRVAEGIIWPHWSEIFSSWLLIGFLVPVQSVLKGDPFLLLKIVVPLLFCLNVLGMYFFARKGLNWSVQRGLMTGFLFAFQLAILRISWESHRNLLGLGLLLFALPFLLKMETKKDVFVFVLVSLLAALSHEYAAVTLLTIAFYFVLTNVLRKRKIKVAKVSLAILPILCLFAANIYFKAFPAVHASESNIVYLQDYESPRPLGFFFITDYLNTANPIHQNTTYFELASHILTLFAVLYLVTLPLVLVGAFKHNILNVWSGLLLIGTFGALVVPFFALNYWHRWMFMLAYPFTFYAVEGIALAVNQSQSTGKRIDSKHIWRFKLGLSKRKAFALILLTVSLGSVYIVSPLFFGRFGVFSIPGISTYFPSSMMSNSLPLQDTGDTIQVIEWLDQNANINSCILVQEAFLSWTRLHLDNTYKIVAFTKDLGAASDLAFESCVDVYFVWWNQEIGWYRVEVAEDFVEVYASGRISAYKHV